MRPRVETRLEAVFKQPAGFTTKRFNFVNLSPFFETKPEGRGTNADLKAAKQGIVLTASSTSAAPADEDERYSDVSLLVAASFARLILASARHNVLTASTRDQHDEVSTASAPPVASTSWETCWLSSCEFTSCILAANAAAFASNCNRAARSTVLQKSLHLQSLQHLLRTDLGEADVYFNGTNH
jgi:hypothetical protein